MKIVALLSLFLLSTAHSYSDSSFCVAHRGNNIDFLENSMASFISAANMEVGGIEFDIHHSKDGIAIVNHDKTLKRTVQNDGVCPVEEKISNLNASEIRERCLLKNGEVMPTLRELLVALKGYSSSRLFIELKDIPNTQTLDLIKEIYTDEVQRIHIISFSTTALNVVKKRRKSDEFYKNVKILLLKKWGKRRHSKYDGLDAYYLSRFTIRHLKRKGKLTGIWTVDNTSKMKHYFRKGIDFITTNNPEKCIAIRP